MSDDFVTVAELMEKLKKMPPDAPVFYWWSNDEIHPVSIEDNVLGKTVVETRDGKYQFSSEPSLETFYGACIGAEHD